MTSSTEETFPVLDPGLQISFYRRLQEIKEMYLQNALKRTVESVDIEKLDDQLVEYVDREYLSRVASYGLRGEVFFPVPFLLDANPHLLGYYRLLFGLSQKEFYNKGPFGRFKRLEEKGEIPARVGRSVLPFCRSLVKTAQRLLDGIDDLSLGVVRDLQLLTFGPQLRGSRNTWLGQAATQEVFDLIRDIVAPYTVQITARTIRIENDSKRTVLIEFFSDPDVRIMEKLPSATRPLVSMEIKGGADRSNIHNRLGEAEKSHQKAKSRGFFEFWTIVRCQIDPAVAREESPTTSHFFHLDRIKDPTTSDHTRFREMLGSLIGIRT